MEVLAEEGVLVFEGDVGDGAAVGVDVEGDSGAVEAVDGVLGVLAGGAGLDVAGGAELEVDVLRAEVLDEGWVFDAADAVADAGGAEVAEGLPYAVGSEGFAGVGGAVEVVVDGVAEGGDVRGEGEAGLVAGDVECGDAGALELVDEMGGQERLLGGVVAESAEDEAGFDAGGGDAALGGAVDGRDDLVRGEAALEVEEWGETDLGVEDAVAGELVEDVFGDEGEGVLGLHEFEAAGGAGEEVGE